MATSRGEPERWGRGARERQAGARLSLIQLHAAAVTPSPVDTLCASQTNGLSPCSAALFLSLRHAPPPLTHTQAHTLTPTHTHRLTHSPLHTQPHTPSHTSHSPALTHTYSSHTLIHHLHTPHTLHKHIHSSHPHTPSHIHTLTHTHTHSSYPHTHTHTHTHTLVTCTHTHRHTHTHTHNHRAYWSEDTGNTGTEGQCSHTRHVERVGTVQSPSWGQSLDPLHTGSHWDSRSSLRTTEIVEGLRVTQLSPDQTSLLCKICSYNQ